MVGGAEPEILFEQRGAVGLVTLNRPSRLNALTLPMLQAMHAQLEAWADEPAVTRIVVRGTGGRAFCAGGDIRQVYDLVRAGRDEEVSAFWTSEYRLDAAVKQYPKPYIALIDGMVMGGGVGISLHGSHRVAAEGYVFAMPEVGIGFFPDVGMTYALPRLPGRTGTYIALTGARIGVGDARAIGLATHGARAADFDAIVDGLAAGGAVDAVLDEWATERPEAGPLVAERGTIDQCFCAETVGDVLGRLDVAASAGSAFAAETAALMRTRSPTSLAIAHELMRRGGSLSFPEAMLAEYRLAVRAMQGTEFLEGVRAAIIDKDGKPNWLPPDLDGVDPRLIAAMFEPLDGPEPRFGAHEREGM
ncbi:enoyl-CoA hydratase/isomerase family protein [Methylobacterium iners]|uniref:3-hydroxyisobutyryl-CoA hydrolase n=1 Tax=Methylobacterium iners TaxID=418707 RepID=A0ABQ4RX30_9HYPH|nr:enoyl-CoA hydratase/isomerase family protein [Methylobacterium iners]GJD95349.1 1,4-dihydroxy-2-naphthoyl-CoA synthase [Methylobacterium iners]